MSFSIQVEEDFSWKILLEGETYPVGIGLGTYPSGEAFESEEEARAYAQYQVDFIENDTAPFPPQARGAEPLPRREIVAGIEHVWNEETQNWDVVSEPTLEEEPSA